MPIKEKTPQEVCINLVVKTNLDVMYLATALAGGRFHVNTLLNEIDKMKANLTTIQNVIIEDHSNVQPDEDWDGDLIEVDLSKMN